MFKDEEKGSFQTLYNFVFSEKNKDKVIKFIYNDGNSIDAIIDTAYETENDFDESDPRYEEYFAMAFKNLKTNELFEISYHNLPEHAECENTAIY